MENKKYIRIENCNKDIGIGFAIELNEKNSIEKFSFKIGNNKNSVKIKGGIP